jgi:hypothetical protein
MPDIPGTTRAQTIFLRLFRTHPFGPPPDRWPSPAILRRWLRKPGFHRAFLDLRTAIRATADFHLAAASAQAAHRLAQVQDPANPNQTKSEWTARDYLNALRLAHLRQRFPTDPPTPTARNLQIVNFLRNCSSDTPVSEILEDLEEKGLIPEQPDDDETDDDNSDDQDDDTDWTSDSDDEEEEEEEEEQAS